MTDIRINQLPAEASPVATDVVPIDGATTRKTTISDLVLVGRPTASQAEAEAGTDPLKVMTPLTTSQAVSFYGLTKAGNLAGLADKPTARANLDLGNSATLSVGTTAGTVAAGDDIRIVAATNYFVLNDIRWLGYVADGARHPLSSVNFCAGLVTVGWTLAQWQTLFPKATALTNEIAGIAVQRFWDLRPEGGTMHVPPGTAFFTNHIDTDGVQFVSYVGENRSKTVWTFINDTESGGNGYGIRHGYNTPAYGTFRMRGISLFCHGSNEALGGTFETAIYAKFNGQQPAWCHVMQDVYIAGADGDTTGGRKPDYWRNAGDVSDIIRGLSWQDVVAFGPLYTVSNRDAFTFRSTLTNAASDSWELRNCMVVGYAYSVRMAFTGDPGIVTQTNEEANFWNFQSYNSKGMFACENNNANAPFTNNYTFHECQCAALGGPVFLLRRVQMVTVIGGLYGNQQVMTGGQPLIALVDTCIGANFYGLTTFCIQFGGVPHPAQNFRHFVFTGDCYQCRIRDYNITNFDHYAAVLEIGATVPAGRVLETGTIINETVAPTIAYVIDQSNAQYSDLRLQKAIAAAKVAGPTLYGNASVSMDDHGNVDYHTSFNLVTGALDGYQYPYPPGLFRTKPDIVSLHNATNNAQNGAFIYDETNGNKDTIFMQFPGAGTGQARRVTAHARTGRGG